MNDIVVSTPEAWEVISRRWKARKGFEKIGLLVIDGLHMIG
jgi:pre-mRNA-splicing helicase BRR2